MHVIVSTARITFVSRRDRHDAEDVDDNSACYVLLELKLTHMSPSF
jgi:hypothetical protein